MWVFTTIGFFSAVADPLDRSGQTLVVRSRSEVDIRNLVADLGRLALRHDLTLELPEVIETPGRDYLWRVRIHRETWKLFLEGQADDLDYPNFKSAVAKREDQKGKSGPYHDVWATMHRTQYREMGSKKRDLWDDDPHGDYLNRGLPLGLTRLEL